MQVVKNRIRSITTSFLLLFLTSSLLIAQSESSYEFKPKQAEGETWVVDYQSDFSTRFRVEAQGKVVDQGRLELIDNRKYSKTVKKVENQKPVAIEHFYVRAERKKQPGNETIQGEEQGAKVLFQWNADKNEYEITSTSHELSEESRNRLHARELYKHFLPDEPVNLASEPWKPDVKNPVSMMLTLKGQEQNNMVTPNFKRVECELADVREDDGRKVATIAIRLSTSESRNVSVDEVDTRLEGQLKYDLDRQKPIQFDITSRPAGISFKQRIEDTTVHVENMGIRILVEYDTSSENSE